MSWRVLAVGVTLLALAAASPAGAYAPPPPNAGFDYQIGGDYPLPAGVSVVSRDWFSGRAVADPAYSICYVNAFQTQANEPGTDRPDERSNWPRRLVLKRLGDDPHWGGEYLIDIATKRKRLRAAAWVGGIDADQDLRRAVAVDVTDQQPLAEALQRGVRALQAGARAQLVRHAARDRIVVGRDDDALVRRLSDGAAARHVIASYETRPRDTPMGRCLRSVITV